MGSPKVQHAAKRPESIPKLPLQRIGIRPQSASATAVQSRPRRQQSGRDVGLSQTRFANSAETKASQGNGIINGTHPSDVSFDPSGWGESTRFLDDAPPENNAAPFDERQSTTWGGERGLSASNNSVRVDERKWRKPQQRYHTTSGAPVNVISHASQHAASADAALGETDRGVQDPWHQPLSMSQHQHPMANRPKTPAERPRSAPGSQKDQHGRINCRMVDEAKREQPHYFVRNRQAWPMHQDEKDLPRHILDGE